MESEDKTAWAFTYATRLAWYPSSPEWSIVGEIMGSEGDLDVPAEYRTGLRWEPSQYSVFAITYDDEFEGGNGRSRLGNRCDDCLLRHLLSCDYQECTMKNLIKFLIFF